MKNSLTTAAGIVAELHDRRQALLTSMSDGAMPTDVGLAAYAALLALATDIETALDADLGEQAAADLTPPHGIARPINTSPKWNTCQVCGKATGAMWNGKEFVHPACMSTDPATVNRCQDFCQITTAWSERQRETIWQCDRFDGHDGDHQTLTYGGRWIHWNNAGRSHYTKSAHPVYHV